MILYFSATGNSKYVAERLAEATADKAVSIRDLINEDNYIINLAKDEKLGIVSPVYCWALPENVGKFINKCTFNCEDTPYTYFVATYGMNTGTARVNLKVDLKARKIKLNANYGVVMVNTFIPLYDVNDAKENAKIEAKSEKTIDEIATKINNKEEGEFIKDTAAPLAAKISLAYYEKARQTSKFSVNEKCTGCGLCAEQCPEEAIQMVEGKPEWKQAKCLLCLGCYHRCPAYAVQYGNNSNKKGQYTNPKTTL